MPKKVQRIKNFIILLIKFFLFTSLLAMSLYAKEEKRTHFTVAIDPDYIPFTQKDIDSQPSGLLIDFWDMWAKKNGYTVSYRFYPWEESLQATKRGEVDFHSGTTNDREWMRASDAIYELKTTLFTLSESSLNAPLDFAHKRIGTIDSYYGKLVKKIVGNSVKIVIYDEYEPMVEALKSGEIDALVDDAEAMRYFFIKTGQMNRFKMVDNIQLQFINKIYAVTNQEKSKILQQINQGMKNLDLVDLVKLEEIWLPRIDNAFYNKKLLQRVSYTEKENAWIKKEGKLTVTGDPIWVQHPDINDNDRYRGVIGDYMQSIASKMNTKLDLKPVESWAEVLATPKKESADIIMGTMNDALKKRLEERYTFLKPYEAGPLVILMDKNIRFVTDLYDVKDKRIGILALQNYTEPIEFKYTEHKFYKYEKVRKLLNKLSTKEIDAVILPLPDAIMALAETRYQNLDIVGKMDEKAYVNIGAVTNKPMLQNIVNKALQATAVHYKQDILSKWTHKLNYIEKIDYMLTYKVAGLLSILVLMLGSYAYILKRKNRYEQEINAKIKELARTDDLTGLHNKRAFNQNFESTHAEKKTLGLLFIDVDYFKPYNDHYGHMEGDKALKTIAEGINRFNSSTRTLYRIGGEEFGMILYEHTVDDAIEVAQKICKKVEALHLEHLKSPFGYVTVSVGIALGKPSMSRHTLYLQADKALYMAKSLGRNTIFFYSEDKNEISTGSS